MSINLAEPAAVAATSRRTASLAPLGITALLVGALGAFAVAPTLLPDSYSWVEHGISESAAQGIDGAWPARFGFIMYGLAVLWLVGVRHSTWGPVATALFALFGGSMFGVAALAAKPWSPGASYVESEDLLHSMFAGAVGFAFVVGTMTLIVARRNRSIRAAIPDWVAFLVAAIVPLTASTNAWGVLQRTMFLVSILWFVREAWRAEPVE